MDKIIIALFITLFSSHVINTSPVFSQNSSENETQDSEIMSLITDGENFNETDSSEYPSELVEEIKSRILKSLNKTEAPNPHVPLPILQRLNFEDESEQNETSGETKVITRENTKTDFLLADVDNTSCIDDNGFPCVRIHFNILSQNDLQGAELWLYKKENITKFIITHVISIKDKEEIKMTTTVYNQTSSNGWVRFDVFPMLSVENISTLNFEVSSENEEMCLEIEENKNPFLLLHTVSNLRSISKRFASYCGNENSTCCRQRYFLNFKDVNWDNWIIQPEGYEANFCRGICNHTINLSETHHAQLLMMLCENNPRKFKEIGKKECSTCVPTEYRPISIIYLDNSGVRVVSHMPGMSVARCGCA